MLLNQIELTILVKGKPITEYPYLGQTFIEGRAGSEYEIEVRNHSYQKIEAIISVDGLSVIDGQPAGLQSRGYLVPLHGTVRVPGWMLDSQRVAKFAFANMADSYTSQKGGDTTNNGVIGVMSFRKKIPYPMPLSYNMSSVGQSLQSRSITTSNSNVWADSSATSESLGTAFGESHAFVTHQEAFERGEQIATMLCYYDSLKGLKARGVVIKRHKEQSTPNAFPGQGCEPPPHWRG